MKKKYNFTKSIGKKNMILAIVALVLILVTVVGSSFSWIEEVSQVEFDSNNGQQTPLRVGSKVLKSDAVITANPSNSNTINLNDYFYKSGEMHLSPCYGDGDNFYFPVNQYQNTLNNDNNAVKFRNGTKDDANVNYLSATFRIKSEGADTAYWFEKSGSTDFVTFTQSSGSANNTLKQYLRVSVTVDGNTNVYAYNDTGEFTTVEDNATSTKTGRQMAKYMYYPESFNNSNPVNYYKNSTNVTNKPNQGEGDNLNGNTLFTVNKYNSEEKTGIKEVTVKIWLQYNNSGVRNVRVSNINLNLVSSWAKTRRVYVKDATVHQEGRTQAKWLTHNGTSDNQAKLFWAIKDDITNSSKRWQLTRVNSTSDYYYVDIPAVYNNVDCVLLRCSEAGWNNGTVNYTGGSSTIKCWNYWETTFPNTFHSEVFSVYSTDFATWNDDVNSIYIVNSAFFSDMYDYMWDSNSVHGTGINDKVVKNANWPGVKMTTEMKTKTNSQSLTPYAFFYNADYDRIIFNDGDLVQGQNQEYQTQDLWLTNTEKNCTFDMTTLTWFHTNPTKSDWSSKMPTYTSSYIDGNFSTNNAWKQTRFAYGGEYGTTNGNAFNTTSTSHLLAKVYIKSAGDYQFVVHHNNTTYKTYPNNPNLFVGNTGITVYPEGGNNTQNVIAKSLKAKTVYRIYLDPTSGDSGYPLVRIYEGEN